MISQARSLVSVELPFRYSGFTLNPESGLLTCRYAAGDLRFEEIVSFSGGGRWDSPDVLEAARLVYLVAGVSYYKTVAPDVIDLGDTSVSDREREFLRSFYLDGLAEYAYRNSLDLSALRVEGPLQSAPPARSSVSAGSEVRRPLVPFGGGIDSIVTVELVRRHDPELFIVNRPSDRFEAIERPAAATGLPVIRVERLVDAQLQHDARQPVPRFLNGHVPITGILSAIAVMAAVLQRRNTVVMSNEWSASKPTLEAAGRSINHQYSKSMSFETAFRGVLADIFGERMAYFSELRPYSELWVAKKFAALTAYHDTFHSCNRAFYLNPAQRLSYWCGECDKCCFINLILAPFLPVTGMQQIFGGKEPLTNASQDPALANRFRTLAGISQNTKPFECVGDVSECRAAAIMAANRDDRVHSEFLQKLASELRDLPGLVDPQSLLRPVGEHYIPESYAAEDLLV